LNNIVTLKSGLEVTQGHSKWYHLKAWVRFPIHIPWGSMLYHFWEKRDTGRKSRFLHTSLAFDG